MLNFSSFIVFYISIIFMAISLVYSYARVNNKQIILNKKIFIIVAISSILSLYNNLYSDSTLKIIFAFIITFLMEKLLFKDNYKDVFFTVSSLTIVSILLEILLSAGLSLIETNIDSVNNNIVIKSLLSIFHSIMMFLIFKFNLVNKYIYKAKESILNLANIYTLICIIILSLNVIIYLRCFDFNKIAVLVISIISLLLLILCLRIIINDKYNNKILVETNKNLKDSYNAYSNTIEECRELKHNLNNDLYSLKSSLPNQYHIQINNILKKYNKNYEWITKIDCIPEGLQGLIYIKKIEAKKKHIDLIVDSDNKIEINNDDYIDLGGIISILIDNAIEASVNSKGKVIEIKIASINKKLRVTIINKFSNRIDINKIGNKNYSTKKLKSGLGLNYINKVKGNKIKTNFKIINDLFISEVVYNI